VVKGEQVSQNLTWIFEEMGLSPTMSHFAVIARDLSRLVGKEPPWSGKYIHSIYHRHKGMSPSPLLAKAVRSLAQILDGSPTGVAGARGIQVLAASNIPEGVLIPATAEAVKCARPGCPVWFVKVHPGQKYHDPNCRTSVKSRFDTEFESG
jgi:hypothetical protein